MMAYTFVKHRYSSLTDLEICIRITCVMSYVPTDQSRANAFM